MIRLISYILMSVLATCVHGAEKTRSLTLVEAERLLFQNNPDLSIGRAALVGAEAGIASADVLPNPQISLSSSSISLQQGVGAGRFIDKRIDTILRVDQQWERGDKRAIRIASARAGAQAAQLDLASQLRQQRIALASAFFDLLAIQQRLVLTEEIARFARRSADIAQRRQAAGDLARVDVARARTDAARTEGDADLARAELRHAQLIMAQLIGLSAEAPLLIAVGEWPVTQSADIKDPADLLVSRPDVAAARARVEAARNARDLAQRQRTRDVGVGFQLERDPYTAPGTLLGVSVSIPLFVGNDYRGDIAKAEADYTLAMEAERKTELAAMAELSRQRIDVEAFAQRARRLQEELLPEARRAASAAEFAFSQGAMGIGDLLDARRSLKAAEQDVIASRADHAKALYAWRLQLEEK